MRTLKKTLCLVLVLAMMVGLCAVGASAAKLDDYSDKDKIENKEAVAILSALGVLEGDERGFRPADTLTRAEGAAIMTRLLAATGAGVSSFTDMASAAWAQPYVAYCEANGIINGMGDGTFQPQATLTVAQFAKMMLCALGYNAKIEGLTGTAWEINTVKLVNKIDLAAGLTNLDYNAAITRDAAAQMAFNTLKANMVEYKGGLNIDVKTGDGTSVNVAEDAQYTPIANNSYSYMGLINNEAKVRIGTENDYALQFCENYFPNLKLDVKVADKTFGFRNNVWWLGESRKDLNRTPAKTIASELADNVLAIYDTNVMVTRKALYDAAKATAAKELTVIANGKELDKLEILRVGETAGDYVLAGYAGATIYLIDTDEEDSTDYGIADKLIIKYPYLAKVTKVTEATAKADRTLTLAVYDHDGAANTGKLVSKEFAFGDYLLVYPNLAKPGETAVTANTAILAAEAAQSVNGTLSKVSMLGGAANALTVGGVSYSIAANAFLGPKENVPVKTTAGQYSLNTGYTAYLSNGFVIGVLGDSVAYTDYVFVIAARTDTTNPLADVTNVGYVKQDGTTSVDVQTGAPAVKETWSTTTAIGGKTMFTDGKVTVQSTISSGDTISKDTPTIGDKKVIADSKTVFVLKEKNSVGVETYKAYTGIANLPGYKMTANTIAYALVPGADPVKAHAAAIYIDLTGADPTTAAAKIYLVSGAPTGYEMDGSSRIYTYTAIVNGAVETVKSMNTYLIGADTAGILVTPTYSGDYVSSAVKVTPNFGTNDVKLNGEKITGISYLNGTLTVNGVAYAVADNAAVYIFDVNEAEPFQSAALSALNGATGYISLVTASTKDATIKTIYVYVPSAKIV
jgi:hypothetical protein